MVFRSFWVPAEGEGEKAMTAPPRMCAGPFEWRLFLRPDPHLAPALDRLRFHAERGLEVFQLEQLTYLD